MAGTGEVIVGPPGWRLGLGRRFGGQGLGVWEFSAALEGFSEGWDAAAFAQLLAMPGAEAALALEAEEPVGFLLTRRAADEAEIITIATRPGARRRGVGRQLLSHHQADLAARGVKHMFLEVAASNRAAIALYATSGFLEVGRRKGYYQRPDGREDAIVMRRELAS